MANLLIAFLGGHEGFVGKWYLDPAGIPTIGYGFTWGSKVFRDWWMLKHGRKMKRGDTISRADADLLLAKLVAAEYAPPVEAKFAGLAVHIRAAGTSMVYNCGAGALKWKWAQNIAAGNIKEGCRLWRTTATTSGGKRFPGLVRRRKEEGDIAEFNRWPEWLADARRKSEEIPAARITEDDIRQAQQWLKALGYYLGNADGIAGGKTVDAVKRFQSDHGTLKVDGIIGPATMSALQRSIDVKGKAGKTVGAGGATAGAGGAEKAADAIPADYSWIGDALLYGGLAVIVCGLVYLAWRYRDELTTAMRKV